MDLYQVVREFLYLYANIDLEIYNEFSLQHELGIFLRQRYGSEYKVQFERNAEYFGVNKSILIKSEIDITLFKADFTEKYAIELKTPRNGQIPEQMFSMIKDIKFLEQLKYNGFDGALQLSLINDPKYYSGSKDDGIYKYFRSGKIITGRIHKPTGSDEIKETTYFDIEGRYNVKWENIRSSETFFMLEI